GCLLASCGRAICSGIRPLCLSSCTSLLAVRLAAPVAARSITSPSTFSCSSFWNDVSSRSTISVFMDHLLCLAACLRRRRRRSESFTCSFTVSVNFRATTFLPSAPDHTGKFSTRLRRCTSAPCQLLGIGVDMELQNRLIGTSYERRNYAYNECPRGRE